MSRLSELDPFRTSTKPSHKSPSSKDTSNIPQSPQSSNTAYTSSFLNNQAKNLKFTYPTNYKPNHITSFSNQKTSNNDVKKHPISYQNFSLKYTPPKSQSEKVTPIKAFTPISTSNTPFTPKKSTSSYKKFQPKGLSYLEMTQPFAQSYSQSSHTPRDEIESLKSVEIEIKDRLAKTYSAKHSPASSPWIKSLKSPSSSQGTPHLRAQTINTDILRISLEKQLDKGFKKNKPSSQIGTPTITDMSDFAESIISQFEHRTKIIEQSENLISKYSSPKAVGYNKHLISKKNSTNSSAIQSPKASGHNKNINKQIDFDIESLRLKESENNTPQKKQWDPLPEDEEVLYLDPENNEEVIKENSKEEESRQEGRLESSFKGMDLSRESPEPSNKTSTLEVLFDAEKKDKTTSSKEIIASELHTPEFSKVLISRSGSMNIYDTLKKHKPSHLKIDSKNLESSPENSKDEDLKKPSLGSSPNVSPMKYKVQSIENIQQAILKESFVEEDEEFSLKKREGVNSLRGEKLHQMKETPRFPSDRGSKKSLKKSEVLESTDLVQEQETVYHTKEAGYTKKLSEKLEEKLMELRLKKPEALKIEVDAQIESVGDLDNEEKSEGMNVSLGKEESENSEEPIKTFAEERNENKEEVGNASVTSAPESSFNKKEEVKSERSEEKVIYGDARSEHSNEKCEIKETEPLGTALEFGNKSGIFERNNLGQVQVNIKRNSLEENQESSQESENASATLREEESQIITEKANFDSNEDGIGSVQQVDSQERTGMIESKPVKEEFAFEELAQNESVNLSQEVPQEESQHIQGGSQTESRTSRIENKDIFVQNSENSLTQTNEEEIIKADQADSHERFSEIVPLQVQAEVVHIEELVQNRSIEVSEEFIREGYLHAQENSSLKNERIKTRAKISFPQSSEIILASPKQEVSSFLETNRPEKEENRIVTQEIEIDVQKENVRVEAKEANLEEKTLSMEVKEEVLSLGGLAENRSIDITHQELTQDGPVDVKEKVHVIQSKSEKEGVFSLQEFVQTESIDMSHQDLIQEGSLNVDKSLKIENKRSKNQFKSSFTQNAENEFILRGKEITSNQDTTPANEERSQKVELDLQKESQEKDVQQADSKEKPVVIETKSAKEQIFLMEELVENESVDVSQKLIEDESVHIEEKVRTETKRNESESKVQSLESDFAHNKQEASFTGNFSFLAGAEGQVVAEKAEIVVQKESENEQKSSQEKATSSIQQIETKEEMINFEEFAQVESVDVSQELTQEQLLQKPKTEDETISLIQNSSLLNSQIVPNKSNILSPNKFIALNPETHFQQLEENESVEIEATKSLSQHNLTFHEFKLPSIETSLSEEPTQKLIPPTVFQQKALHKNLPKTLQISSQEILPTTPKELPQNTQQGVPLFHSQSQESPSSKPKRATNPKPKSSSHYKSLSLDLPSQSPEQHNTPTRLQEIALLSSVVINDSPKKVSLMKKGIIMMDDNMTEGSNHQEDPNFCKEYYTDSRVSESCSFQDIDESSREHSPSRCELISFEEFSVVPKDNRKSQTSPKRPNIQFYYEEKSQEKIEKKRSTKESIEINISQIPFNISNTAFSAFSGDFNVSSVTKNEQEMSGKNLSFFTGEQQQNEISQTFDQNISPINAPKYFFSQELGRKLSSFALSRGHGELEGRPSNLQVSEGEKGGFVEPKSLGNSGEFQRIAEKESKSLMKMISTLESIDRESDHSVNVDSFILPSNLSLPKTQELKMSTGDFDVQGDQQGENESQTSSPEVSFNGGKSVIPMMKFENLNKEFENISLTGSIIVFDNNIYYANNAGNNNKELEKRPLDDLNPVTEERSLEITQSEETKSEAKTDSLTETQQGENELIVMNKNLAQENFVKKTGAMGFSFPKIQQELKISTEDLEENNHIQGEDKDQCSVIENSVEIGNGEIPVMKFEDFKTDFNKISLTGSMIVFDNNLYYSNNEEKKELEKQPLDDLDAVIEERSLEMTQSEEANSEAQSGSLTEPQQKQDNELAVNQQLAKETVMNLQENALEKYFKNVKPTILPFPKLQQNLRISTEDPEENEEQNLTQEKSLEIGTDVIPAMKLENFKTDFEKISMSGSMIVFDNNLYSSNNENNKDLETELIDDSNPIIEERSLEMTQSEETINEVKGNSLTKVKQQLENELGLNMRLARNYIMTLQENALEKYFKDVLAINKSLAKENIMILQERALEKYFNKKTRSSLEKIQSEEANSKNSLTETQQQQDDDLILNKSLAKENMIILQENALERYFKNSRPSLEKMLSEETTNSKNSLPKAEEQLTINKSLAKENMTILQENALNRYFKNIRSANTIHKFQQKLKISVEDFDRKELSINKYLAKENMIILQENALAKYFRNVRSSFEKTESEGTESETSFTEIQQELTLNKSLAKENMMILQENALERYFKNVQSITPFSKFEEQLLINKSLAKENMMILQENALEKYFKAVRTSLEKTESEETESKNFLSETEEQLVINKSLAKENMKILQKNALEKYFRETRPSIEKMQAEESDSENSLTETQQQQDEDFRLNKSLAKENVILLQENALEKYFKKSQPSLEKIRSEEANSENSLTETQQEDNLRLNRSLAKENVILLQESALKKYFSNVRPTNLSGNKIPKLTISPANFDLQREQKEDNSQNNTPEESLNVEKEMEKINLTNSITAFDNSNNFRNEELEMWALGDLSPVCEERSCEIICSEANSPITTQQQQPENDLTINKTLAKENIILLQENALKKFFDNTIITPFQKASELKISPINIDLQEEQRESDSHHHIIPEETPNVEKEMTKINLASSIVIPENPLFYSNPLKSEEFEMWALGNLSPVCEEKSCEITCSEANSPTTAQKPQENNLTMKTLTKENVIHLQENAFKRNSKNAGSLHISPPRTQEFTISSGDIDLQEVHEPHSNTPGKLSNSGRSPVPMMKFENLKADFESISLTGSIILDNKLPPVTEERSLQSEEVREAPLTATFRNQLDDEILLLNKKLARKNVLIIQENALRKYFNCHQRSIPETMTFRSKAIDSDRPDQKVPIEELQERKSNPKVLKPLMSFGGNEEGEEEAKSLVLPTDLSAQDAKDLSDISEIESLNNSIATPKITASPLAGPKSHEADSEALKESIFLNSHSPYHENMNTQEDRLPTFGSSILKQPTINSIMSSNPEKSLSDNNQSISGSTESHNDSPTKQSQPVKFRNSFISKGFTMAQTLMMTPDLGFSSPMSIDKGQFNQPPTLGRHTSVPSDQDSNHKRPSKMSASTSNLFRLTPLDGTVDLLEERKSIDTRGSQQRSLQYEKTKSIRRSFLHKNLLQSQFSTEEIMANNSHNKHRTGGQNRENLSKNTAKSSGEVSERFSLSDISLSMLQNEELNLSNNGDISGEIAPQEDFLKSLNFNDSLLLPGQLTRNGSLEELQYDVSAVYNENIGRIETYKKLGNIAGCVKLLKELAHEVEKQEKEEGEESPDSQKEMINYKFYKIQIYNMLSLEYYDMKSFEEALEFTNKVIELDRYNMQALYKSYQIHVKLKKDAEAKSILKRVRKLMQFQPMSGSFQHMKLDNISIPSALSSSTNGSFYEGLQNMGSSLAFAKMNGGDWGKSLSRFKLQHTPVKNDQASNSGN